MRETIEMLNCDLCDTKVRLSREKAHYVWMPDGWIRVELGMIEGNKFATAQLHVCDKCASRIPEGLVTKLRANLKTREEREASELR